MRSKLFICALILCCGKFSFAQRDDAQFWENLNIEKNLTPKLIARVVQQGRVTENFSNFSYNYLDMGFNYKFSKHIHVCIAYVWAEKRLMDYSWSPRHQAYVYVTLRKKYKDFNFNDRQMILWQIADYNTSPNGHNPDYYLRNKFTIRWDHYFKIAPYLAAEIYYKTNSTEKYAAARFDRIRTFAGVYLRKNEASEFEIYYLREGHLNYYSRMNSWNPQTNWVLGLGYTYSF